VSVVRSDEGIDKADIGRNWKVNGLRNREAGGTNSHSLENEVIGPLQSPCIR